MAAPARISGPGLIAMTMRVLCGSHYRQWLAGRCYPFQFKATMDALRTNAKATQAA